MQLPVMRLCPTRLVALVMLTGTAAHGQPSPAFEVASVKPSAHPQSGGARPGFGASGGPGTPDPVQFSLTNATLKDMLVRAYDVENYGITAPAWIDTERFDIKARVPPNTTEEQFNAMLRNLLAERFHVVVHRETKDLPGYDLVAGKNGAKLTITTFVDTVSPLIPAGAPRTDADGFHMLEGAGYRTVTRRGPRGITRHTTARAQTMSDLVSYLMYELHSPVNDKTGLTGRYDYQLDFAPPDGAVPDSLDASGEYNPGITIAIQEQLGLKLEPRKVPTEVLIVDRADKVPTRN